VKLLQLEVDQQPPFIGTSGIRILVYAVLKNSYYNIAFFIEGIPRGP